MVAARLLKPLTQFSLLCGLLCVSVVPLGWSSLCHLGCGVNRSTMETCQWDGACPIDQSCLWATQTPFKTKILHPQNPKCSAWSNMKGPSVGSPLRSKGKWMLAGELLWPCPWNVVFLGPDRLSGVPFVSLGYRGTWQLLIYTGVTPVAAGVVTALLTGLNYGFLYTLPPQPWWRPLLRRQAADTHQILEFCCWQETWKTESHLLVLYMRNP